MCAEVIVDLSFQPFWVDIEEWTTLIFNFIYF